MSSSKARAERRKGLQVNFAANSGGGYGQGNSNAKPATGNQPGVNPFMIPKKSGLNIITSLFPDNYYTIWDLGSWRAACDQAQKMGYPVSYATLVNWCFEASTFIQSLFVTYGDGISRIPCYMVDEKGNKNEVWTDEVCNSKWFHDLRKEIVWSNFWGFTGLNIDPLQNKTYKYPMSQIDPINRMLRESTYNFTDGMDFAKTPNLLFVQPSTSYERFLGWMQPITREFIMMNMNSLNWVQAGKRLAFPLLSIGYPQGVESLSNAGSLQNVFREEAEAYARDLDPSKTLLSPYTIDQNGKREYAIDLESHDTGGGRGQAHKIYEDFNTEKQNNIRELCFGGTLTSSAGKNGARSLGLIHETKLKIALEARNEDCLAVLNDKTDFLKKIKVFYKNFPDNLHFDTNRTKEWDINEIKMISDSLNGNQLKLTTSFFNKFGLDPEDIEEAPEPLKVIGTETPDDESLSVTYDRGKHSLFGVKKKVY